jgi:BolA protein
MNRIEAIRQRIERQLSPEHVDILDDSSLHQGHAGAAAGGGHFRVRIVSNRFANRSLLERHRMVYQAVNDMMPAEIHALSIQALTPEEQ